MAKATPRKGKVPKKDDNVLGKVVKALGRAAAQNPVVAQNLKYARAVQAGPTAVAKTVAVDLAAGAIGAGVGRGVQLGARAVARTGIPARAVNKVRGEVVGLHGSPVKGLKQIEPRLSEWSPKGSPPQVFAANPAGAPSNAPRGAGIPRARETAQDYALGYGKAVKPKEPGSIYVVKGKRDKAAGKNPWTFSSPKPMRVVAEVEVMDPLRNTKVIDALRRAGVKVPKKK